MVGAARRMLVIIAALFLSAGHVACACASASTPMSRADHAEAEAAESADPHAHHQAGAEDSGKSGPAPAHQDCSHCETVALAGDATAKIGAMPTTIKNVVTSASPVVATAPDVSNGIRVRRLHWAAPPPRSPVDLKIRLRN